MGKGLEIRVWQSREDQEEISKEKLRRGAGPGHRLLPESVKQSRGGDRTGRPGDELNLVLHCLWPVVSQLLGALAGTSSEVNIQDVSPESPGS